MRPSESPKDWDGDGFASGLFERLEPSRSSPRVVWTDALCGVGKRRPRTGTRLGRSPGSGARSD